MHIKTPGLNVRLSDLFTHEILEFVGNPCCTVIDTQSILVQSDHKVASHGKLLYQLTIVIAPYDGLDEALAGAVIVHYPGRLRELCHIHGSWEAEQQGKGAKILTVYT